MKARLHGRKEGGVHRLAGVSSEGGQAGQAGRGVERKRGLLCRPQTGARHVVLPLRSSACSAGCMQETSLCPRLMSSMVVMGRTGSLQKTESWKSCSRRWRNTETRAGGAPCSSCAAQPHWCSTGGRTRCWRDWDGRPSSMAPLAGAPAAAAAAATEAAAAPPGWWAPPAPAWLTASMLPAAAASAGVAAAAAAAAAAPLVYVKSTSLTLDRRVLSRGPPPASRAGSWSEAGMRPKVSEISCLVSPGSTSPTTYSVALAAGRQGRGVWVRAGR